MSLRQAQPARATIRDVAAQAGVSVSSVSRVMNGEPHISPELHARIMRAVNRLRFEPHSAAQALRSRESKTIGCMVADLEGLLERRGQDLLLHVLVEVGPLDLAAQHVARP